MIRSLYYLLPEERVPQSQKRVVVLFGAVLMVVAAIATKLKV